MDDYLGCKVCYETYTETTRPRSLPCGHTLCTSCLHEISEISSLRCPICKTFHVVSIENIPVNYELEEVLSTRASNSTQMTSATSDGDLSQQMEAHINDQRSTLTKSIQDGRATSMQLAEYYEYLQNTIKRYTDIEKKLRLAGSIMTQNLQKERELVNGQILQTTILNNKVEECLDNLDLDDDKKDILHQLAEVYEPSRELRKIIKLCKDSFPDPIVLHKSMKVRKLHFLLIQKRYLECWKIKFCMF